MTDTVLPGSALRLRAGALVGRTAEITALESLLDGAEGGVVSLTGPVGVGKSRLAAEIERRRVARGDLVVRVQLGALADRGLAADAVIAAAADDAGTPAQALWRRGQGAPLLLLLDDADQVAGLGELVLDLLDAYPALTVLATLVRPMRVAEAFFVRAHPWFPFPPTPTPRTA